MNRQVEQIGGGRLNQWFVLLLPFLVTVVRGVLVGVIALRSNRRAMRWTRPVPPDPEPEWWGDVPLAPLHERPVDAPYRPE